MLAMSPHFDEIHGVDVSDEMVALARRRLSSAAPHAHVHATSGTDLGMFEDGYFDFVYSYIVFQHIPERDIVLNYLREARRVLRPGGVLCCQLRGTAPLASEMSRESETWTGCYFNIGEIAQFSREEKFPLVAASGLATQYTWATFRRPLHPTAAPSSAERCTVKSITAASGPGASVPSRGPDAAVSLWVEGMPDDASLAECAIWFGGEVETVREQTGCYLSPVSESGGCQINSRLPDDLPPGEYNVELRLSGRPVPSVHRISVTAAPPYAPGIVSVTDGINLTSWYRVETGGAKAVLKDIANPAKVSITVGGNPVEYLQYECRDPITSTWEFAFHLWHKTPRGRQSLKVVVDGCELAPVDIEVV
jgi:hypothetical protein